MNPPMNRRALPPPAADRREGVRGALLHTLPGRAIVVGLARQARRVPASASLLGGVPPFLARRRHGRRPGGGRRRSPTSRFRLIVLAKRRLLWRVRRKLILSYIFIGFIPALLLVAFSLLCGFLLFYNFSSYLVQSRLRALSERGALPRAERGARDPARRRPRRRAAILALRQANAARRVRRKCRSPSCRSNRALRRHRAGTPNSGRGTSNRRRPGPWTHVDPPAACRAGSTVRASPACWPTRTARDRGRRPRTRTCWCAAWRFPMRRAPGYAVVVDLLVNDAIRQQLRKETGVELKSVTAVPPKNDDDARPIAGRDRRRRRARRPAGDAGPAQQPAPASSTTTTGPPARPAR